MGPKMLPCNAQADTVVGEEWHAFMCTSTTTTITATATTTATTATATTNNDSIYFKMIKNSAKQQ